MQKYVIGRDFNVYTLKYIGYKVNVDKTKYLVVTSDHCISWIINIVINKNKFEAVDKYLSAVSTSESYQTVFLLYAYKFVYYYFLNNFV